jgi:hypothetical protein
MGVGMTRKELISIKMRQPIVDPFPLHTEYNNKLQMSSEIHRSMGIVIPDAFDEGPKDINIWEAWAIGYNRAYEEIAAALGE